MLLWQVLPVLRLRVDASRERVLMASLPHLLVRVACELAEMHNKQACCRSRLARHVAVDLQAKNLTKDEYAMNHPAGRIGKRLILRVADIMLAGPEVPTVPPTAKITEVLGELSAKGCGCVLIVAPGSTALLGTFTDGDLRRSLQSLGAQVCIVNAHIIAAQYIAVHAYMTADVPGGLSALASHWQQFS